jgi:MFS family permease
MQQNLNEHDINFKHNIRVNVLDGAFFWVSASFFASRTIGPLFLSYLTDNTLVFGLLATITATGWLLPQLFTAGWVQRTPRKRDIAVRVGFFAERIPIFLLPLAAWMTVKNQELATILFLLLIAWHIVGAGVIAVAWQDMIAKIIPVSWRGRFFGIANFAGNAAGIAGASAAAWILSSFKYPTNFMITFGLGGLFMLLSWISLSLTREPADTEIVVKGSRREYIRNLSGILTRDTNYRQYLTSQVLNAFGNMALGFLTVYTLRRWQVEGSTVSLFTTSMLVGTALGNLALGSLADRKGHKTVLEISTFFNVLAVATAFIAPSPAWFFVVFIFQGFSQAGFILSGISIIFEFTIEKNRPIYIGLTNTIIGIFAGIAPLIGGLIVEGFNFQVLFLVSILFYLAALAVLLLQVREPRFQALPPA